MICKFIMDSFFAHHLFIQLEEVVIKNEETSDQEELVLGLSKHEDADRDVVEMGVESEPEIEQDPLDFDYLLISFVLCLIKNMQFISQQFLTKLTCLIQAKFLIVGRGRQ